MTEMHSTLEQARVQADAAKTAVEDLRQALELSGGDTPADRLGRLLIHKKAAGGVHWHGVLKFDTIIADNTAAQWLAELLTRELAE